MKQIALQVPSHDHQLESILWQWITCQVATPPAHQDSLGRADRFRFTNRFELAIHAKHAKAGRSKSGRVTSTSHGDIERAARRGRARRERPNPLDDERRGRIKYHESRMAQALVTSVGIGIFGLVTTAYYGFAGLDVSRHIAFGFFSSLIILLSHSMMMFYFIGKGKAVKDAMAEGNLTGDYHRQIAAARKPVFSIGSLAMVVTMVAAIVGGGVDTGVLPPMVHATIAYAAIASNLAALKVELDALGASSRVVDEVNRLLGA